MSRTASKVLLLMGLVGCSGGTPGMDAGQDRPRDAKADLMVKKDMASPVDMTTGMETGPDVLVASCNNRKLDGDESDVDCGGTCPACPGGNLCKVNGDCQSKSCVDGFCDQLKCTDGVKNGMESD